MREDLPLPLVVLLLKEDPALMKTALRLVISGQIPQLVSIVATLGQNGIVYIFLRILLMSKVLLNLNGVLDVWLCDLFSIEHRELRQSNHDLVLI